MMGDDRLIRREFLGAALAGTAGVLGLTSARAILDLTALSAQAAAANAPPETTRLRLVRFPSICFAPQFLAEEFLRAEGFNDVQYIKSSAKALTPAMVSGEVDISLHFAPPLLVRLDAGDPIVLLAGSQVGCFELFGNDRVRAIRDLKGKTVAVTEVGVGPGPYTYISILAAYVGLDPRKDINWVTHPPAESKRLLAEGKVDAYMGFPPDPQELRAKKVGHVVVNSAVDRPWSQYFCCLVAANREFVRRYPTATKGALRAILKSADVCPRAGASRQISRGQGLHRTLRLRTRRAEDDALCKVAHGRS